MDKVIMDQIKKLCRDGLIIWSQHSAVRCQQRGIKILDIESCLMRGEIIEKYPEDYPYCSYLILGETSKSEKLHVVCGIGDNNLWIITAYFPSLDKWEPDFRVRKENN